MPLAKAVCHVPKPSHDDPDSDLDAHARDLVVHRLDLAVHADDLAATASDLPVPHPVLTEIIAVTPKIKLRIPVNEFVFDVRKLAAFVSQHAERMSLATNGKISDRTAARMNALVDQLVAIDVARVDTPLPSSRSVVREAEKLITSIGIAGRYVGETDKATLEHLGRVRRGKKSRAAASVKFALDMHASFARETRVGSLMPGLDEEAAKLIQQLEAHVDTVKSVTDKREANATERKAIVDELKLLSSDVRALVKVLARVDPEFGKPTRR